MSLLMIHEQVIGYMEFFDDTKEGLESAKKALMARAEAFHKAGYDKEVYSLSIQRVKPGHVFKYDDDASEFPDVFHFSDFDDEE